MPITHPDLRGRALELFDCATTCPTASPSRQQFAAISDVNYLDQFYNPEWLNGMNQETFAYLKQQKDFWYWSVLAEDRIRPWITETNWLPKLDGYVAGVDLFDMLHLELQGRRRLCPAQHGHTTCRRRLFSDRRVDHTARARLVAGLQLAVQRGRRASSSPMR